ncbi:lysosomal acid glucosylceramidase-like isoform X2 [Homarus americanus]|uniref:lysosomal acid glucosylceramidase-like isoform X2 n=1 Tax=Homarus americanus TaxID=6706 RepID=UPI001C48A341|nr:lysosomal acid glucosylceramidase-like isoform X2 [Homarus americanus]
MIPTGGSRSSPLIVVVLLVIVLILGFNYWSLSSQHINAQHKLEKLQEEIKRSAMKQEQSDNKNAALQKKAKDEAAAVQREKMAVAQPNIAHGPMNLPNIENRGGCKSRNYGHGSIVCVCDTSHCDTFPPVQLPDAGEALIVTSSKAGLRWQLSTGIFLEHGNVIQPSLEVEVDSSVEYQKIIGFGGAFTDASGVNILSLPKTMQDMILKAYYSVDGLEYNLGRVPIGGTDFSTHPYTYDDLKDGDIDMDLSHFSLADEDLKYKIPLIHRALNLSSTPLKLFGSAWGAPAWMKDNNNISGKGKLLLKMYSTWADYHVRFIKSYGEHNITFWGLTTQNEPTDGLGGLVNFNAVGWTSEDQAKWIGQHFGPALHNNSLGHLTVMILDDNRFLLPKWVDDIMIDGDAAPYVSGVAIHWYSDWLTPTLTLDLTHERHPELFLLYTEACTGQWPWEPLKVVLGSWTRAEDYAVDIIENLEHWVSGWTDWNLALDVKGGPNWIKNFVDSPIIINAPKGEFYKQPMYYALAHFTKFLPEGSRRVALQSTYTGGTTSSLSHTAFVRPDNTTVLVFLNKGHDAMTARISDKRVGQLNLTVEPHTIITMAWKV